MNASYLLDSMCEVENLSHNNLIDSIMSALKQRDESFEQIYNIVCLCSKRLVTVSY